MQSPWLSSEEYKRYGRQMILDGFGLPGQLKLKQSSIVVVGAGGLGCPALQYLAATGIGRLGIIDHDVVELSNLQRQILHNEGSIGVTKSASAARALRQLNSHIEIDIIEQPLVASNAITLLSPYDLILDCTDNSPTRYLLSDAAVALNKPLVSGAAQKYDGQVCVYNFGPNGPCYRCLFPMPPSSELLGSCEETGVLGVVTGIIGTIQAVEAINIIAALQEYQPSLLLFSALSFPFFRTFKLRPKKTTCLACGPNAHKNLINVTDYVQFCGGERPDWVRRGLSPGISGARITATQLKTALDSNNTVSLIDVRPPTEFGICCIPGSMNVPLHDLATDKFGGMAPNVKDVYIICRLGNDSQIAAEALRNTYPHLQVKDVIGGLRAWTKDVDPTFPVY